MNIDGAFVLVTIGLLAGLVVLFWVIREKKRLAHKQQ